MFEYKGITLLFYDFVLDQERIFFSAGNLNGLFQADLKTGKSKLLGVFPGEKMFGSNLHCGTYRYKTYILFVPLFGKEFAVYDMAKGEISKLQTEVTEESQPGKSSSAKFFGSTMIGKNVYAFGWDIPEIVSIDMETLYIKKYTGWLEKIHHTGKTKNEPYFYKDVCVKGSSLFVVMGITNAILELNMENNRITIHSIGRKECIYKTLAFDGKYFWLTDQMKGIARVDGTSWEYQDKEMNALSSSGYFNSSVLMNREVWLFANKVDNNIYRIKCEDFSVCEKEFDYAEGDKWFPNRDKYGATFARKIGNDQLAILTMQDCMMHILTSENDIHRVKFYADAASEMYYEECWFKLEKRDIILERCGQPFFDQLKCFLHYIESNIANQQETKDKKHVHGDGIYQCIR